MSEFHIVRSETLTLTGDKAMEAATKHSALPPSPTERGFDVARANKLRDRIKERLHIAFNWATVKHKNKVYRMNGQHSSKVLSTYEGELPERLVLHIDSYEANTIEAIADLFRQFDARWSSRSSLDVSGAYQGLCESIRECPRDRAKLALEGWAWYTRVVEGLPLPSADDLYPKFSNAAVHPFILWACEVLDSKATALRRAPVIGAMYGSFIASESGAREFWKHVMLCDIPDDTVPSSALAIEMGRIKADKVPTKPLALYAMCAKAWKAFRTNDPIKGWHIDLKKGVPEMAA